MTSYMIPVMIRLASDEDMADFVSTANESGLIHVSSCDGSMSATVTIMDEDGSIFKCQSVSQIIVRDTLAREAALRGWINESDTGELVIDIGQFDIWAAQYVFQIAAFGEEIVA